MTSVKTAMATKHARAHARLDGGFPVSEQGIIDWFPAVALFIFVAYHGLRDTIASMFGMYGLVVYALTCAAWFLLVAYWLREGMKLTKRFILLPTAVFAVFAFYMAVRHIDVYIFEEYALPQAINPMGGMVAFVFLASQNDASLADAALKLATVIMTVFLQSSLGSVMQATTVAGYDMGLGFDALFFALLSLHFIVDCRGVRSLPMTAVWALCTVSNVALILSYGSRGPLLGLIAFAALRFLVYIFGSKGPILRKMLALLLVIGFVLTLVTFLNGLVSMLNHQLNSMGITSRTLEKFLYADIASDSGRSTIWNTLIPRITALGNGPFSDQAYLGPGNYCHNFFLEVFYDFGIPFGIVILCVLAWFLVLSFWSCNVSPWFPIFLTLLAFCIGRLGLSGTFWTETYFWGLLAVMGLCTADLKKNAAAASKEAAR